MSLKKVSSLNLFLFFPVFQYFIVMMKKIKLKSCLLLPVCLFALFFITGGCKSQHDYSGTYTYQSGACESGTITLTKVQGFGDKYYLVTVYGKSFPSGKEFLGTIDGRKIELQNGTVIIEDGKIEVISGSKSCIYVRLD